MARPRASGVFSIAQLEKLLDNRRREMSDLMKERNRIQTRLDALDRRLATLSGGRFRNGSGGGAGTRARNPKSLTAMMEDVLGRSGKPMNVGDIAEAVQRGGYRSNSANFRAIVNQTLIKDKRFGSAGRGMYQLKK
jgi:hypothetical protein